MISVKRPYAEVRHLIHDGDGLFYRVGHKLSNRLIAWKTGSHIVHVGMAAWWGSQLWILETLQWKDARGVRFSTQVKGWPGQWDWYPIRREYEHDYRRGRAVEWMKQLAGTPYGWLALASASLRYAALTSWMFKPDTDDSNIKKRFPFCSMAVSLADKLGGGIDPVSNVSDKLTTPAHLAASGLREYRFTLT